jgi:hypothetical protein
LFFFKFCFKDLEPLAFKPSKPAYTKKQRGPSNKSLSCLVVDTNTGPILDPSIMGSEEKLCNAHDSPVVEEVKATEENYSSAFLKEDDSNFDFPRSVLKGDFLSKANEDILQLSHDEGIPVENDSSIIPIVETQLSSVHVTASIPLGLDDPFPLTLMSTDISNNNALAEDPMMYQFVDDGYQYLNEITETEKDMQELCQCCRCANKSTPHLANVKCPICQDSPMFDKCVKEFGFICKNCPPSVACQCNLCVSEPVKLQKLKNGYCSRCQDTAISSLCALRKGICSKCSTNEVNGGTVQMVVENFNAHYDGVRNKGGQTKLSFVSNTSRNAIKVAPPSSKKAVQKTQKLAKKKQSTSKKSNILESGTTKNVGKNVPAATTSKLDSSDDFGSNSDDDKASETDDVAIPKDEQRKREAMTAEQVSIEAMKNRTERKETKAALRKKSDKKSEIWTYFSEVIKVGTHVFFL